MNSVRDAILVGIGLCAAVIAIFLRNPKVGVLAALTVPVTLAVTFLAMRLAQQTLNLMSLGGMAVAISSSDDAIVVVEAISRHRDEGADPIDAARRGTRELVLAVIVDDADHHCGLRPSRSCKASSGILPRLAFTLTAAVPSLSSWLGPSPWRVWRRPPRSRPTPNGFSVTTESCVRSSGGRFLPWGYSRRSLGRAS
jgi:multidrug efflux pump subunit AcrB